MTWVRIDDRFPSHRKVALVSDKAFRLYVSALCWSSENLTEGRILDSELRLVAPRIRGIKGAAAELETAGLWDRDDAGWTVHDYLDYNPSRARVREEQQSNAERQKAWRDRQKAKKEAERNGVTGVTRSPENDATATRRKHDDDTTTTRSVDVEPLFPQVNEVRNGVTNGAPSPARPVTTTSFGSSSAPAAAGGLPDPLAELKRGIAAAGLAGIAWDLKPSQWEYTKQALDRVGVPAMVAFAANSSRLKGAPAGASAWVGGWRSLEPTPELPPGAAVIPLGAAPSARPSTTDQRVAEGMALAARLRAQEAAQ